MFSYSVFIMFLSGVFTFCFYHKHLLLSLLSLEYLVLILFLSLFYYLMCFSFYYFLMIFLVFSVCEGSLGLSLLVSMIRCHGNDMLMGLSFLKW